MALTAADIAQSKVASLVPEAPLVNAHRLFVDEQISGAPVVDDEGLVVGVVSAADLLRALVDLQETGRVAPSFTDDEREFSLAELQELPEDLEERLSDVTVSDVMTASPVCVDAAAPVREVAKCMRDSEVHRVIVVREGQLVGIISTLDLVGVIADGRALD